MKLHQSVNPYRTHAGFLEGEQLDWLEPLEPPLARVQRIVSRRSGRRVEIRLNRNRSVWVSIASSRRGETVRMSLHEVFLQAPDEVLHAVAGMIGSKRRRDDEVVKRFIDSHSKREAEKWRRRRGAPRNLRMRGRVHDLGRILSEIGRQYFPGYSLPAITWGKRRTLANYVTLGSYSFSEKLIRIHPVLDDARVPSDYIRFVVYHELLHHIVPERRRRNGRRNIHSEEFKQREREFVQYHEAQAFEKKLFRILGRRRVLS